MGAPKAGTDELYYQLDQHPQIYMSPLKEPCFFSREIRRERFSPELQPMIQAASRDLDEYLRQGTKQKRFGGIVTRAEDYESLFAGVKKEIAVGEGSVSYLWSESAARTIAESIPQARIIIVLMDPAQRAFHQYLKSLRDRNVTHSFREHLKLALKDEQDCINIYHPFLAFGDYPGQVRRYMDQFPPEHIHLSLYDDLQRDYKGWFRNILEFLKVDPAFTPNVSNSLPGRLKAARFALRRAFKSDGITPELSSDDRRTLVSYYRDSILELESLVNRDLSVWLRV